MDGLLVVGLYINTLEIWKEREKRNENAEERKRGPKMGKKTPIKIYAVSLETHRCYYQHYPSFSVKISERTTVQTSSLIDDMQ